MSATKYCKNMQYSIFPIKSTSQMTVNQEDKTVIQKIHKSGVNNNNKRSTQESKIEFQEVI